MRYTIAYKKQSVGILYIALTILGAVAALSFGFGSMNVPATVISGVVTLLCAVLSVRFLSLPSDIIMLSDENTVILPKGKTVPLTEILDVSYRRAFAKGMRYRWGTVIVTTLDGKYRFGFVADCADVSEQLMQLVRDEKRKTDGSERGF